MQSFKNKLRVMFIVPIHVSNVLGLVGNGCTEPLHCILSNGDYAIVKTLDNVQGNLILANELFCYFIAAELDLPIPQSGICLIDDNTEFDINKNSIEFSNGLGFYSRRLDKVMPINNFNSINILDNKDKIMEIVLFDHVIYNKDRNKGNALISISKNEKLINIIDHTHVFKYECLWDEYQLKRSIEENDYLDNDIMRNNSYLYKFFFQTIGISKSRLLELCDNIKSKIDKEFLINLTTKIPTEWNVSKGMLNMLVEYIYYRINNLDKICDVIIENSCF